jgi:hypothetical protein
MEYRDHLNQIMTEATSLLANVHLVMDLNKDPHQRGVTTTRDASMEQGMPEDAKKKSGMLLMPTMNSDMPNFSIGNASMDSYANIM